MSTGQNIEALLPISENNGSQAVNARDLHAFLESKQQFSDWIKGRIDQFDFEEGVDFEVFDYDYQGNLLHKNMKSDNQRVSKTEYALSIDMAKELSMVERNEKGKQARRYFIACEKGLVQFISTTQTQQPIYSLEDKFKAIELSCKCLRASKASKARMINSVLAPMGLPVFDYVESDGACLSAKDLLEKHQVIYNGKELKSVTFNKIMEEHGYIERVVRSTKKGKESFASLTEKGLKYGRNDEPTQGSYGTTQPKYFVKKFPELLHVIGLM